MSEIEDKINSLSSDELDLLNSDPEMLSAFKAKYAGEEGPGMLKSGALGLMSGIPGATTAVSGIQAIGDKTYEEAHKGLEEAKDAAWETHPGAYGVGKTAGMVGTALAAPVSIPGAVGVGALAGLDAAARPTDMPVDALKGAAIGGVFGTLGEKVISPAIKSLTSGATGLAKRGLASLGSKTTLQDVEQYLENPNTIRGALSKAQLGEKVADVTSDIGEAAGHLSSDARSLLNPKNALNSKDLKDAAMESVQKYFTEGSAATAADETAIKSIVDQYQKLAQIAESNDGNIPENTLRSMIDRMQAATKESTFGNPEASASQTALKEFSGKLNDLLRKTNPTYAEGMAPSAELAKLSSEAKGHFGLNPNAEGNLAPTNVTASKLSNVTNEVKPEGASLMDRIKNATGQDLTDMITNSQAKERFEAPGAGGALKTLMAGLGFGVGKTTGIPFGGIGGAAVGRYAAEGMNGGMVAKKILDAYIGGSDAFSNSMLKPVLAKYGPVLINAAKAGGNQLAATHFVLSTSDPEYQTLVQHMQDNIDER